MAERGILKVSGKERGCGFIKAGGLAAVEFGADGVEIHEPALEQRPRHRLQRRVHPPVQLDLVVQRSEDVRDGFLFGEGWQVELKLCDSISRNALPPRRPFHVTNGESPKL